MIAQSPVPMGHSSERDSAQLLLMEVQNVAATGPRAESATTPSAQVKTLGFETSTDGDLD